MVHHDDFEEYTDETFTDDMVHHLDQLEKNTVRNPSYFEMFIHRNGDDTNYVSRIGRQFGLHSQSTRIILHPNFAIIYESDPDTVTIGEIFYNIPSSGEEDPTLENVVLTQMRLAFNQITEGKEIHFGYLEKGQKEILQKVMDLDESVMDQERGLTHGK